MSAFTPLTTTAPKEISKTLPYETKYISVLGSQMAYIEAGDDEGGDPILFIHGNPTSKYLWRNIMPYLEKQGHVVAVDLIGMGESDKPDIDYRFHDHYCYLESFIHEKFGLRKNITLVIHDWGSALGFNFASKNPDRIKGIAFMEAIVVPLKWTDFSQDSRLLFMLMRTPYVGYMLVQVLNIFINVILPQTVVRKLSREEKAAYAAPFRTVASRKPTLEWPREIPIEGYPADNHAIVDSYCRWLQQTKIPKILFAASPGTIITESVAAWVEMNLPNLTRVDIGEGLHFIQEDNPHLIGEKLSEWYKEKL